MDKTITIQISDEYLTKLAGKGKYIVFCPVCSAGMQKNIDKAEEMPMDGSITFKCPTCKIEYCIEPI